MIWERLAHFRREEFLCPCCNHERMDGDFLLMLDDLRHRLEFPLVVTSGYRCPVYNNKIASTGYSGPHTTGRAVDLAIFGNQAFRLVTQASLGGWMSGIGLRQHGPHERRFIHLDNLESEDGRFRPTIWTYEK